MPSKENKYCHTGESITYLSDIGHIAYFTADKAFA
jgi:hypothetical protein